MARDGWVSSDGSGPATRPKPTSSARGESPSSSALARLMTTTAAAAVGDLRRVAGGDGAVGGEGGLEPAQTRRRWCPSGCPRRCRPTSSLPALADRDGHDLARQPALLGGDARPLVAHGRQLVLPGPGDAGGLGVGLGAGAHVDVVEGAPQAVADHGVHRGHVAQAVAGPGAGQQVGGLAHRLHAPGHDHVGLARLDQLVGQVDGVDARQAHAVDGDGGDVHRHARPWPPPGGPGSGPGRPGGRGP